MGLNVYFSGIGNGENLYSCVVKRIFLFRFSLQKSGVYCAGVKKNRDEGFFFET